MKVAKLALFLSMILLIATLIGTRARARQSSQPVFAPIRLIGGDERKAALGRDLFFDRRLSGSMQHNCASCHDLSTNGATGTRTDRDDLGRPLAFNTPTLYNSIYNFRFGWDGKIRTIQEVVLRALRNEGNGGGGVPEQRLAADPKMAGRFRAIYGGRPREGYIVDALSTFIFTLVTPDAPFDRWLEGDARALTPQQLRGHERFTTLGCAGCHQGRNVGGNIIERSGIFHPLANEPPRNFRVPSLRNVAVTAPYFHNGSSATLPDAVRQMARSQLDLTVSDGDVRDVTAFLRSLTGSYSRRLLRSAKHSRR